MDLRHLYARLSAAPGRVVVTALFADQPFTLDARGDDTEQIDLVIEKE